MSVTMSSPVQITLSPDVHASLVALSRSDDEWRKANLEDMVNIILRRALEGEATSRRAFEAYDKVERFASQSEVSFTNARLSEVDSVKKDPGSVVGWYVWMITKEGRKLLGQVGSAGWKTEPDGGVSDFHVYVRHFSGDHWPEPYGRVSADSVFVI